MIELTVQAVVTDIEGTTTDIDFVHRVLFPYARERIARFVRENRDEPAVRDQLAAVARESGEPLEAIDRLAAQLEAWIDADRKITPLKTLQGMIWRQGYADGDFRGHLYPDAYQGLRRWREAGLSLWVFSSGSVEAQQLLFGHSDHGDLRPWFSGWFDTTTGAKREPAAYQAITDAIGETAQSILFLSDVVEELDAAATVGLPCIQLVRSDSLRTGDHPQARSFDAIHLRPAP